MAKQKTGSINWKETIRSLKLFMLLIGRRGYIGRIGPVTAWKIAFPYGFPEVKG